LLPVQADGVGLLDLDNARAPATGDPQDMLRDFGEALPCARSFRRSGFELGIVQDGIPVFVRRTERGVTTVFLPIEAASFSICFGVGIRMAY
jgi:hypothetical protein